MSSSIALLSFAGWTLLLVLVIASWRGGLTLLRRRSANSFAVTGEDLSPFAARLARAHANCVENLPVVAVVLLVAITSGHTAITDPLAPVLVAARVGQSTVHLLSTNNPAVVLRYSLFMTQQGILVWWLMQLLRL